ncbi:MAG: nitrogenase [Spirochaetaceae bacterium]|nr:MAG: nitrogenase [Spirochaetaceae bacterium]
MVPQLKNAAVVNACKLCTPLGAALAFHGIEGAVCLLHGSQGCSTYIRRYLISHFKEPIDIASSNFSEESAIYGGANNLKTAIMNIVQQYNPVMIGIASTCLSETIGDDVKRIIRELKKEQPRLPEIVSVSTASYRGTHVDGFHAVAAALVKDLAEDGPELRQLNLMPGMASPADIRFLHQVFDSFGVPAVVLPDYSETLDGGLWHSYTPLPPGGTKLSQIRSTGRSMASIEFGHLLVDEHDSAGAVLASKFGTPLHSLGLPIGIRATDLFMSVMRELSGGPMPEIYSQDRARLADSYADGHKYVFGKRAVIFGEEDLVIALAAFLQEIGMIPAVVGSGGNSGRMKKVLRQELGDECFDQISILDDSDFDEIERAASQYEIDIVIGHSKGYKMAKKMGVPHVRTGFPIHDRFGGQRLRCMGYDGTQRFFDALVNALLEKAQNDNPVGYTYL